MILDEALLEWAEGRQAEYLKVVNETGGYRSAAKRLGVSHDSVRTTLKRLQKRARLHGWSPEHDMVHTVPDPFTVKRLSTNYDKYGHVSQQWVIATPDAEKVKEMQAAALEALAAELPRLPALEGPPVTFAKLCTLYTVTDYHMGMLAKAIATGADWDMEIAEALLIRFFEMAIAQTPPSKRAILNQLGDFLHWDGLEAVTPTSKHVVDSAGSYSQMVKVSIRVLRRVVDMLLQKHEQVVVVMAEGNHDLASSVWLRHMFSALYEHEPRVAVNDNELPYYAIQHGQVFLGFHHGHKKKKESLPLLFAQMYRSMFGQTTKGYIHTGHYHNVNEDEHPGFKVIQHPTLAAPDNHTGRGGWISEREANVMVYHEDFGQVGRITITPEMLDAAA